MKRASMKRALSTWRVPLGVALLLVLGGPAPGSVGNCNDGIRGEPSADPMTHCTLLGAWVCARMAGRGEITSDESAACAETKRAMCQGINWPMGCSPTQAQSDNCIRALQNAGRLSEPDPPMGFPECALCTGRALTESAPILYEIDPTVLSVYEDLEERGLTIPLPEETP